MTDKEKSMILDDQLLREETQLINEATAAGMIPWQQAPFHVGALYNKRYKLNKKRGRRKYDETYGSDLIISFDIETTSFYKDDAGKCVAYNPGMSEEFFKHDRLHGAIPYIWMCKVEDNIYFGRSLESFTSYLMNTFAFMKSTRFVIWVHNLSYEFRFLSNVLTWEHVFCRDGSSIMKGTCAECPNVEFRCSYMLTTLSLASWGKSIGLAKLTGDLDYNVMRTPVTTLTDEEYEYCRRDVEVVCEGIKSYLKQYNHLLDIPLTGTGEVRRLFKTICAKDVKLNQFYAGLIPTARTYCMLKETFAGGYTHANEIHANRSMYNLHGFHYDFTSSYPYVMISEKFPSTKFEECDPSEQMFPDTYAYIIRIRVKKLKSKVSMHYISYSKCLPITSCPGWGKSGVVEGLCLDNGRVVNNIGGDVFDMYITEQDLDTILKAYDIDYEIVELYKSLKAYLPKEYIEQILELYGNKTRYKDVDGMEDIYAQSKRYINGVYGCFVMKLVDTECVFDNATKEFTKNELDYFTIEENIDELKKRSYGVWNSYAQGVWITAYARHNLWECILQNPDNVMYCDTDSIFCYKKDDFSGYNTKVIKKMKEMAITMNLDFSMCTPATPAGVEKPLGIFDLEDEFTEFKTLGAKRYVYRPSTGKNAGKLVLTVSGINKGAVDVLEDNIDNFQNGMVFHKDHPSVKRNLVKYFYNNEPCLLQEGKYDEYYCFTETGANIRPTSYTMGADDYCNYLEMMDDDRSMDVSFDTNFRE